jgi:hypothetical protein
LISLEAEQKNLTVEIIKASDSTIPWLSGSAAGTTTSSVAEPASVKPPQLA